MSTNPTHGWARFVELGTVLQERTAREVYDFLGLGGKNSVWGLINPPDVPETHAALGANCGPASLAASLRACFENGAALNL